MWLYFLALIVAVLLYGSYRYLLDLRQKLPPGPIPLPFIGTMYKISPTAKIWVELRNMAKQYGKIFTVYLGQYRMIVLDSHDVIHEAMSNQNKALNDRPSFLPGFAEIQPGILLASGTEWQERRRFSLRAMREFGMGKMAIIDKLHDEISHLLAEIDKDAGKPFAPNQLVANAVSNIICSIVFGKRFEYEDRQFITLKNILDRFVSRQLSKEAYFFMLPVLSNFITHPATEDTRQANEIVGKLVRERINENRKDFDAENIRDFPDLFIQAEMSGDAIDIGGFIRVMTDMFAAGTETTATALTWSLLYLTKYPHMQERCHKQIDEVIGTARLPTLSDRPHLTYLDAVMCETFRHVSILPISLLHANIDGQSTVQGYEIPPGSIVAYNVYSMHYDEGYWENPETFNPDRWLDAEGKLLQHSARFIVFGTGPRICLGESLARVEYFEFLVSLLQRFSFSLADKDVSLDDGIAGVTHGPPQFRIVASKR